ncbi:Protein kinase domain containing protein [Apiospora aurea]|uniref:Protein kinase domain containing protein n=1 Tax=Apiospora aurea TaxID=335848 RepID=A0ABR1PSD4_9PEZI
MARFVSDQIAIVDFGEAYATANHKKEHFGIPGDYGAPEILLGGADKGIGTDIYALGHTLLDFQRRHGIIWDDGRFEQFENMEKNMGPCPPPFRELARKRFAWVNTESGDNTAEEKEIPEDTTELQKHIRYDPEDEYGTPNIEENLEYDDLSPEELALFSDLLHKMFQWKPEDRWTIDQILTHRWFSEERKPAKDGKKLSDRSFYAGLISPVQTSSSSDTPEVVEEPMEANTENDGNDSSSGEEGKGPDSAWTWRRRRSTARIERPVFLG